jgi:soluble lytic murein transglycosylase-like protein/LysM repeat protein
MKAEIEHFFNVANKLIVYSHRYNNTLSPLQLLAKQYIPQHTKKQIQLHAKVISAIGALALFGQLTGKAIDQEFDMQDQRIAPLIQQAKLAQMTDDPFVHISKQERLAALIEYQTSQVHDDLKEYQTSQAHDDLNKHKILPTLEAQRNLRQPHADNLRYYQHLWDGKVPSASQLSAIGKPYGVSSKLLKAILHKESGANNYAISHKQAKGAFQFLAATAKEFNLINKNGDMRTNGYASADTAARYLSWLNRQVNGSSAHIEDANNLQYTLAAYNAGWRNVLKNNKRRIPNFPETQDYVTDIMLIIGEAGHIVKRGEHISQIAKLYNVEEKTLLLNNLEKVFYGNQDLQAGDVLNVSQSTPSQLSLTIKKGFNLWRLQEITQVPMDLIAQHNNLHNMDKIKVGDKLIIPSLNDIENIKHSNRLNKI